MVGDPSADCKLFATAKAEHGRPLNHVAWIGRRHLPLPAAPLAAPFAGVLVSRPIIGRGVIQQHAIIVGYEVLRVDRFRSWAAWFELMLPLSLIEIEAESVCHLTNSSSV